IAGLPFFMSLLVESKKEADIEHMFLEFSRDLVEGVKSGTPISKSIINTRNKDYGSLNPYIEKLANQIALGIPVKDSLDTFAKDIKSPVISRAISLIREAEVSGGRIESILESVAFSISQIEKLKKERKAAIYNLTVQGYIIFFIFILIMLVMQFKIIPIVSGLNLGGAGGTTENPLAGVVGGTGSGPKLDAEALALPFLLLLLTQGFFAGLVIGKISEGTIRGGLKHSFILVAVSWLISTGAKLILG
ncbi:MAG: type II secretion system F family protein, partial [Nanoarchaeota archaeon]